MAHRNDVPLLFYRVTPHKRRVGRLLTQVTYSKEFITLCL